MITIPGLHPAFHHLPLRSNSFGNENTAKTVKKNGPFLRAFWLLFLFCGDVRFPRVISHWRSMFFFETCITLSFLVSISEVMIAYWKYALCGFSIIQIHYFCEHIITFLGRRKEDSLIQKISQWLTTGKLVFSWVHTSSFVAILEKKSFRFLILNTSNALHGSISVLCLSSKSIKKATCTFRIGGKSVSY